MEKINISAQHSSQLSDLSAAAVFAQLEPLLAAEFYVRFFSEASARRQRLTAGALVYPPKYRANTLVTITPATRIDWVTQLGATGAGEGLVWHSVYRPALKGRQRDVPI